MEAPSVCCFRLALWLGWYYVSQARQRTTRAARRRRRSCLERWPAPCWPKPSVSLICPPGGKLCLGPGFHYPHLTTSSDVVACRNPMRGIFPRPCNVYIRSDSCPSQHSIHCVKHLRLSVFLKPPSTKVTARSARRRLAMSGVHERFLKI